MSVTCFHTLSGTRVQNNLAFIIHRLEAALECALALIELTTTLSVRVRNEFVQTVVQLRVQQEFSEPKAPLMP